MPAARAAAASASVRASAASRLSRVASPNWFRWIAASLALGVLAAVAAFLLSLPDRSRYWVLLPLPALVLWASTIAYGCLTDWVRMSPEGMQLGETARCFATLILTSAPLLLLMLLMLRHAAWWHPAIASSVGATAVGAFTATALSLLHDLDASSMVLLWNFGVIAILTFLGSAVGPRMLRRVARR